MHTFSSDGGAVCAAFLAYRSSFYAALGLLAASVLVYGQARTAESPRPPQAAMGDPVNLYVPNAGVYGPSRQDGEIHPRSVQGKVWLMAGEPGESNVAVQLGDQGVLVVDTGTQAMASKLLSGIQRLAGEHGGDKKGERQQCQRNDYAHHKHLPEAGYLSLSRLSGRNTCAILLSPLWK